MKQIKQLAAAVLALLTVLSTAVSAAAAEITAPVKDSIDVEKIAFSNPDFIRGMDISSVISLENAGVSFKNGAGETQDIFALLAGNGVNYIRVRIWNHPYDSDGNGYGGGNSDLAKESRSAVVPPTTA